MSENQIYLGIDIGGTNTKIALVKDDGVYSDLVRFFYGDSPIGQDEYLQKLIGSLDSMVEVYRTHLAGIGVSCPGLQMESGHGTLTSINMPILNKFDMKAFLEDRYQKPVVIHNDLVSHSLAESFFGIGRGVERFLNISIGTGIGHAYIYKGKPQFQLNGISGESGRMIIDPVSEIADTSGVYGSAEGLCGVNAIEIMIKERYPGNPGFTAQDIISKAREGTDPVAIEIMRVISRRLALLLINLATIYFPQVISISGGQTEAGPFFIEECQHEFDRRAGKFFKEIGASLGNSKGITIAKAKMGGLSGLIGSVVPFINH